MSVRLSPPLTQVGYVVRDIHHAVTQWTTKLGVGPFCVLERTTYTDVQTDGIKSRPELALAFAYTGDLQIELIQPLDNEPSAFRLYPPCTVSGFHHIGRFTDDLVAEEAHLVGSGLRMVGYQASEAARVSFFDGGRQCGGLVELISVDSHVADVFRALKQAAAAWDGETRYWKPPA